ncbi:hypothetical protein [bacterium endosymbiont of Bathymodiolus sp. 5 South]|jgi:hypothetical protein|nr:hypothetical protein [bacterium endosymbiont of Bathymodiolus sp. 5 South]CAC9643521.1 hypothetical protein [uncultured Gammaproteobacteria bacterium]CAC9652804.1 hypothetical protein [uncultured Gammaproteobacteria bacterium]CAC9658317.1 hypothetical protein [uncultured Gammaproteobacteria bacterium]SHN91657.1 hypothetical protein BCLUESOX_2026 [bacterium endosymbiont of Bathymodiolus sp. 5 South]VVH57124.1 hypothetical protein BSPCLSOX_424 [uncultured Gammaproteobacteria bacterium]
MTRFKNLAFFSDWLCYRITVPTDVDWNKVINTVTDHLEKTE